MSCCDGSKLKVVGGYSPDDVPQFSHVELVPKGRAHQLQDLEYTFPPDNGEKLVFGRPTIHDNGDIEYVGEGVPDLNGYYRDAENPRLFHPLWGECSMRLCGSKMDRATGHIVIKMLCNHPSAESFQQQVSASECAACPLRQSIPTKKRPSLPKE
jgi:hypothetical protein